MVSPSVEKPPTPKRPKFTSSDRMLFGWQKWLGRSHPTEACDKEDYALRKTIIRLQVACSTGSTHDAFVQKSSLESAARNVAKSTMLPWDKLMHVWRNGRRLQDSRSRLPGKPVAGGMQHRRESKHSMARACHHVTERICNR